MLYMHVVARIDKVLQTFFWAQDETDGKLAQRQTQTLQSYLQ